jgi:hypothetical protein
VTIPKPAEKPYVAGLEEIKARLGKGDERWTISIEGPGGVGKSALAFEIARWASDSRSDYRLAPFSMLPILLESWERSTDKAKTIDDAAAAQLRSVMNAVKISDRLLQALLSRKRVLVVVDGISEMAASVGQGVIWPDSGVMNARALVVTSRLPTNLPESLVIRPQGLTLAFLDRVLDGLVAANVGAGRFNEGEREELRRHLRSLIEDARDGVKERQVPMIFLKLMIERADQLLKEKKPLNGLPRALSELVTDYTERQLLRNEPDIHMAMRLARTTAQVCMGKERRPAARSEYRYESKGVSKEILDNFVTAGLIVRSGEKGDPFYKFALDPIAEQLDANRLMIDIREDRADQTELDELLRRWEEMPQDFLSALRRATTSYCDNICAIQPTFALKLWPHEITEDVLNAVRPVAELGSIAPAQTPMTGLEQSSLKHLRVFISYSHDSAEHARRVRALADQLRKDGIDARIDQYTPDPDEGWSKWMRTQVKEADRVLLVFTETYQRRYEGDEEQGKGQGATFEGVIVTQALYEGGGSNAKFRPVVFREEDERFVSVELRRFNRYRVDTPDHYQNLLRWLYREPSIVAPTVGPKRDLPPEPGPELFASKPDEPPASTSIVPALDWDKHLGHTYRFEGAAIYTQAVQLSARNISGRPVRLQDARLSSGITGASAAVVVETAGGSVDPSDSVPIPPSALVTLKIEFIAPTGLLAQEFIDSWGLMYLSVSYDGEPHEVKITEEMTRKLYEAFRPYPLNPKTAAAPTIKWSKDGTLGKSTKDHGYYKIQKEYVQELGVEEDRYMVYYQRGSHSFEADGTLIHTCHMHGFKTLEEAQFASESNDVVMASHLGL